MRKPRLDRWMVDSGLVESREKAQALIMAGDVLLNGQKALKPGQPVPDGAHLVLLAKLKYVSRGGLKLEAALREFQVNVEGCRCADFGSSTGGFTDCLLQRGARFVYAIDAGANQLDWRLRSDPRVSVHEGTNARYLNPELIGEAVDICVCDVSFISATMVLPAMIAALKPAGQMIILVKPQFEAGRELVGKGGIVRDPEVHRAACEKVAAFLEQKGFQTAAMESPLTGAEGNKEFLMHAHR